MSNFSRKIKKELSKEERRLAAVEDWLTVYGHNYPNVLELSADPVATILDMMKSHDISVKEAAKACEDFALEWLSEREELPETD